MPGQRELEHGAGRGGRPRSAGAALNMARHNVAHPSAERTIGLLNEAEIPMRRFHEFSFAERMASCATRPLRVLLALGFVVALTWAFRNAPAGDVEL
jgi:hypothetical protein